MTKRPQSNETPPVYFRVGDTIAEDGIYRVLHGDHRFAHEVTLLAGQTFPPCEKCGSEVRFQMLRPAESLVGDGDFRIQLYRLPHPDKTPAA